MKALKAACDVLQEKERGVPGAMQELDIMAS
jgi:hypothetical protein